MNLLLFNLKTDADDSVLGFTTDWINALAGHCEHITVITMTVGRIAVPPNVEVFSVGKEKGWSESRRAIEFYRLLCQALHDRRFDACFAHMMPLFALMGWPLLKKHRVPITLWYAHRHVSLLLRAATAVVDHVVASSKSGFQIETPKLRIIGQGIDTERFVPARLPDTHSGLIILTVGRISSIKRLEVLIQAVALLDAKTRSSIRVHFVGDPLTEDDKTYLVQLRKETVANGVEGRVVFQPGMPFHCIQQSYRDADIFVNSSDTDSVDKTVLEAMSTGLPIVTSNVALCDVLGPELSGKWVVPKNDVQIMAERLKLLANMSTAERKALGATLRDIVVQEHSLPSLVTRLLSVLKR